MELMNSEKAKSGRWGLKASAAAVTLETVGETTKSMVRQKAQLQ
jgi:hypothetical protein